MLDDIDIEIARGRNPVYFVDNFCTIKDEQGADAPFRLWPAQTEALKTIMDSRLVVLLKARQIGMTTLVVGYAVWMSIYQPGATILLFSKSHREAKELLE